MKKKLDILKWLLPLVVLLATACGHDDLVPPDVYEEKTVPYVELRVAVPLANPYTTRANPTGGEEGDGRERGTLNEDKIHNINVFFYIEDAGKGMDSDDAVLISHFYYNLENDNDPENSHLWYGVPENPADYDDTKYSPYYEKGYVVIKLKCTEDDLKKIDEKGVNFVAAANVGLIQYTPGMKLSELREKQLEYYGNSWLKADDAETMNAEKMDYFQMSTAYNGNYLYGGQYTGENKIKKSGSEYTGTTTLQRLYSRLDLWYNKNKNAITEGSGTNEKVKELKYAIVDEKENVVKVEGSDDDFADVYITNVLPVNVMQKPSFLFKKVIEMPEGYSQWNALTNSSVWNSTSTIWKDGIYSWGGKESPNRIPNSKPDDLPLNYVVERHTLEKSVATNDDLITWYGNSRTDQVKTDIMSEAKGPMKGFYHGIPNSDSDQDYGCDRIAIISYANENTHPTDCYNSRYLTGMAFRAIYVPDKIYTTADLTLLDNGEESFNGMKIYRYSPTIKEQAEKKSLYFTDRDEAVKYAQAHPEDMAIISAEGSGFDASKHDGKWGFVCYYNLWLRHYNNENGDPTENYPMEYATVRNNIYRVSVSFRGPGDPEPTMREPDTMKARIFVRKWNYREEPEIIF